MNVYAGDNKKMLNMLILEILKEYTDAEHRLTQQEIIDLLKAELRRRVRPPLHSQQYPLPQRHGLRDCHGAGMLSGRA